MVAGRKPKLQIVKDREGDRSHNGKSGSGERLPGIGVLEVPEHLTPVEKELWAFIVRSTPVGVLARADASILERYVVAWARWRECDEAVKADGMVVMAKQGPLKHPLLATLNIIGKEMLAYGAELGLSPVARQRIMATKIDPDDEMEWLLNGSED